MATIRSNFQPLLSSGKLKAGSGGKELFPTLNFCCQDIQHMLHPRSVGVVKFEGNRVEDATLSSVSVYFTLYFIIFAVVFLLLSLEPFDFETVFSAASACFNNVGPGFGAVGPASSFAMFSAPSKLLLSLAMLLGRLEIFPILLACSPSIWIKR